MKKTLLTLVFAAAASMAFAQEPIASDSWALGLGIGYPRFASINIDAENVNYKGYISIQRNFSEHIGLRLKGAFSHMEGSYTNLAAELINQSTNLITGDLDMLFYPVPCEEISPYILGGVGASYKMINNPQTVIPDENDMGAQLNLGVGVDFTVAQDVKLTTEFGYHISDGSSLDGTIVPGEVNAQDSHLTFTIGVNFIFGKGEPSELCEKCGPSYIQGDGQADGMTKQERDRLIYNSKVVDRYILSLANDKLVLVGVNFAFDESTLLPESYAVLNKTVKLMKEKPEMKVEISGYTDYVGSSNYNIELSRDRANTVKKYLVSKGISEKRLSIVSEGQGGSAFDNKTAEGREMNRKVMLRIIK
ncbi:MAG: hypothetical protein CVV21_04955 [Candidatus Goldiibacteriota bacterium HGW-Goldbacteria-1]|jgi:OOP family OmpA-OmpF porin|nr:MAG: hypothetical protein CVV21_04955 [Candidatus Goldiibacteriota bacterium HGW-Goldbacteria-1]